MSHVERGGRRDGQAVESGLAALRSDPAFRGPVASLDGDEPSADHLALVYESRAEQFAAVVPFVRQGLERGEQCLYVAAENSRETVLAELREGGVDVDAALDSGALTVLSVHEAYLRDGTFDVEESLGLLEAAAEDAEEFAGFRVAAEERWLCGDAERSEEFMELEARVNDLFGGENYMALCQYDRTRHSPEVIEDVIRTHPYLVCDNTVCENVYYAPPAEYFGPEAPAREIDRKLETLVDRADARLTLQTRERFRRELYEIVSRPEASFEEKLGRLLALGSERFGLEIGYFTRTDGDTFEIVDAVGSHEEIRPGVTDTVCDTYCEKLLASPGPITVTDAAEAGWTDDAAYERFGLDAYFATTVDVGAEEYGTLCFASETPRREPFSDAERTFLDLMGQWLSYELERRRRERYLRESYAITSNPELSFDEKLERLLELGCERLGLEMGGLNHLPSWEGEFRLEKGVGLGIDPEDGPLWTDPSEGAFCRQTIESDEPVCVRDVNGTPWEDDPIHEQFGLTSYVGTRVTSGSTPYGTLWFASSEPRERPFTDADRTFLELMGQWVGYEIERRGHKQSQRELYEITADSDRSFEEKVDRLLDLGRERFGLGMGFFLEEEGDEFRVVRTRGTDLENGVARLSACPEQYCKRTITVESPVGVEDVVAEGWDDDPLYREYGLGCYLGTRVFDGDGVYGSVCFADGSARDREFTDAEYAFLDLLGQWLSYELERKQREADLEETIDSLQQSNDRLKQFAYAASHDLQEPLRMVSSYLQLLENGYGDDLDAEAREYIDFAVDGADRMRAMVDDLLAFSRVEHADASFEPVDCERLIERVTDDLAVRIDENDAEIDVGPLPTVQGDAEQLEQLFANLVSNAVKYNESERPRVEISAREREDHWEFAVADDGIGIDPEKTDRIFEVFKRLHHDDEYPGTGIGLALCQEIVDNHDGDISVESEPGEGSTFTFTLPRDPE